MKENIGSSKIELGRERAGISLQGINRQALANEKLKIVAGRSIHSDEQERGTKVALVSDRFAKKLYKDISQALGQKIEILIKNKYLGYTIIGVYEYRDKVFFSVGSSAEDAATECFVPLLTVETQLQKEGLYNEMTIAASSEENPEILAEDIKKYVNERFYQDNDAYEMYTFSSKAQLAELNKMMNTMKLAFTGIGAIALLVGGIGVMNIMIVSITERTKEIGTRKALGATNKDIRLQFISESVVICILGGIIGVILGLLLGMLGSKVLGLEGSASLINITACVIVSVMFGVFFGSYPAHKAAKMNPIEALRYE